MINDPATHIISTIVSALPAEVWDALGAHTDPEVIQQVEMEKRRWLGLMAQSTGFV